MKLWGLVTPSSATAGARLRRAPNGGAARSWRRLGIAILVMFATLTVDVDVAAGHAPHDDVTDVAVSPDYAQDHTVFAIIRQRLMRSSDGGRTWTELVRGLGGEAQVLARIAIAPSDTRVLYVTSRGGGVVKSEDGGSSWRSVNQGLTNLTLQDVAVSPVSPDVVLVAGGAGGGLFLTTNGGVSWSRIDGVPQVTSLAFLSDGSRLVVGQPGGRLVTSGDMGTTWDPVLTVGPADAISAMTTSPAPESPDTVFVASSSGRLFRSDDGGESFAAAGDGLPDEDVRSLELSPHYAEDATVWASTWSSGVFRSTDKGETWEPMSDGLTTDPQADEVNVPQFRTVAAGPGDSGDISLFVGGFDGLFRYDDRRGAWDQRETLSDYIVGLAVSPDHANDGTIAVTTYVKGAFVSRDDGHTWEFANEGLTVDDVGPGNKFAPLRRLHNVVFSPDFANDGTIFSASWVRLVKSTDRGASWSEITIDPQASGGELRQFVLAVSPSYGSDQTVFAATRQGEIFRSESAGEAGTWDQVGALDGRVRSLVISPDYANDGVVFAGTVTGVHVSADRGATWNPAGLRMATQAQGGETDPAALVAISPAYGVDGTVFAGTDSGLFVTRDAGGSWSKVTAEPLTDASQVEAIAVSPDYENDRTVLVSTRQHGLLRSTDGGATFAVSTELLDSNHLVADFSNPTSEPIQFSPTFATDHTIFAYAQTELVVSTDGGESWDIAHLPSGADVLESLESAADGRRGPATRAERGWFETPVGNLSVARVLAAAAVALVSFAALRVVGLGGRGTRRSLSLQLGGGVALLAVALVVLAA